MRDSVGESLTQASRQTPMKSVGAMADVQARADARDIALDRVGVKGLRYPVRVEGEAGADVQHTIARVSMSIRLSAAQKGAHMSRFVEVLDSVSGAGGGGASGVGEGGGVKQSARQSAFLLSARALPELLRALCKRLESSQAAVKFTFPFFRRKRAPVSEASSLLDYQVTLRGEIADGRCQTEVEVVVPVTSLCPCSKAIADYGAHNQRSHITLRVRGAEGAEPLGVEELIAIAEQQASSELYGLLKRADEKFITERAYDNPKFVEDVARDVSAVLRGDARVANYAVSVENFESIHNHSAYAHISGKGTGGGI